MGSAATSIPPLAPAHRPSRPPVSYSSARRASVRPAGVARRASEAPPRQSASIIPFPRTGTVPRIPPPAPVPSAAELEAPAPLGRPVVAPGRAAPRATAPDATTARHRRVSLQAQPQQGLTLMILRADGAGARHVRLTPPLLLGAAVVSAVVTAAALGIGWQIGSVTAALGF
jgi:hypothetical protein